MRKEKRRNDPVVIVLDLVILAMTYVIIMLGIKLYTHKSYEKKAGSFMQDANAMSYDLETNNYASLIQGTYMNEMNDYNGTEKYHELAKYTEAAFFYKVYDETGKNLEAGKQKDIMDDARQTMGSFLVFADKVDAWLRDFGKQ